MNLTLAIPVHDDPDHLVRLLKRSARLGVAQHVVIVDDGSDPALDRDAVAQAAGLAADHLTLLRHDRALGPGAARNRALEHVATEHVLFMDADDLPTRELPGLLADLDGQDFDFCIFQHHDTRVERDGSWGQTPHDLAFWRAAGVDLGALNPVPPAAAAQLVQTANYPWNKICRTGFLRDHGIGCSEILVHEDIELHWRSFLNAGRILASDRIAAIHFVTPGGGRLTNRLGPERLAVFAPLETVFDEISARQDDLYALPFWRFTLGLIDWIDGNLLPELQDRFAGLARAFLHARLSDPVRARIARDDPALSARAARFLTAPEPEIKAAR